MTYPIYDSVETLIAPETLSQILQRPIAVVNYRSWEEHAGFSSSRFATVEVGQDGEERFVLKRMEMRSDWTMRVSDDTRCRSVTLWTHGVLDQLLPEIDHAVVACSRDDDGWALLMRDVSAGLFQPDHIFTREEILRLLDGLAAMHAKHWRASELRETSLGLCDSMGLLQMFSPIKAAGLTGISTSHPKLLTEGWAILEENVAPDVRDVLARLMADPQPLATALDSLPRTLVHGNLRFANLALLSDDPPQPVFLDWQTAGFAPATVDLAWVLERVPVELSPVGREEALAHYHRRLTEWLDFELELETWKAMLELGWFANILRWGCISAWFSRHAKVEAHRTSEVSRVRRVDDLVRSAVKWLD